MYEVNPYIPATTGLEVEEVFEMPTRPGAKELIDLIDLDILERTCDVLGRDLDEARARIATAVNILRQIQEMQLTHAQRNTINELLINMLQKPKLPPMEVGDIPF